MEASLWFNMIFLEAFTEFMKQQVSCFPVWCGIFKPIGFWSFCLLFPTLLGLTLGSGLLCIILYCLCVFKELRTVWNSFLALLHVPRSKHSALEDWGLGGLGMETKGFSGGAFVCHPIWVELGSKWKENIAPDWNKTNRLHVRTTSTSGFYGVAWKKTL